MVEDASIMVYQQVARQEEEGIYFDLNQLKKLPNYNSIYTSGCMNLVSLLGMIFMIWLKVNQENTFSAEFRLLKDRDSLILSPIGLDDNNNSEYFIYEGTKDVKIPLNLSFSKVDDIYIPTNTAIFVMKIN
jgi:tRNA(Ile)-lysidine synthase